jgi:uncharacterized protein YkwD
VALALLFSAGVIAACAAGYAAVFSRAQIAPAASAARHSSARNDVSAQRACSAARRQRKHRAGCHSHSRAGGSSRADHSGGTLAQRSHAPDESSGGAPRSERDRAPSSAHNSATQTGHEGKPQAGHVGKPHTEHTHAEHSHNQDHAERTHTRQAARNNRVNNGPGGTASAGRGHSAAETNAGARTPAVETAETPATARESRIEKILDTPCENTELTPTPEDLAEVEAATLCLINQERARHDERPLRTNRHLEGAAQGHSEEMIADDYFAHVAPSGMTPVQRIEATGYIPNAQVGYTIGENIAWGTLELSTPSSIVAAWIASPEHLANILYAPYRDTGIGVVPAVPASLAEGQPGAMYSQEFGVIER